MTAADLARIEAARAVVLAAHNATRAAMLSLDALMMEQPSGGSGPTDAEWETFDSAPPAPPNANEATHGRAERKSRR